MTILRISVLLCSALMCLNVQAQRYEAEAALLEGGAVKQACASCSGGQHVAQQEGSLTFQITLASEGYFNIRLMAAAPFGEKINILSVDANTIDFAVTAPSYTTMKVVSGLKLSAGDHVIRVLKSWGYINIDYIELEMSAAGGSYTINPMPVTPDPGDGAKRLYQFLNDNYGKKIISGVMTLNSFDETNWLRTNTGREPALVGLDFMHSGRGYTWYNDRQPVEDAKAYYLRNGIPALCWHWRDPLRTTEEFYTDKTSFDVSKVFDPQSPEYKAMISDIDYIASLLIPLRDENIPVIWRPLHEAAGGWFWWGAKGPAACKELYRIMFDRMVSFHGLNNLIWVWTREPNDDAWYPGDAYVDIVGRDIYKDGNHFSQALEWGFMNQLYGGKKMIALSETGSFPDADYLVADGAAWSWFMPWYGKYTRESQYNSLDLWKKTLAHPYVITLDEMPDLATYEAATPGPVTAVENAERSTLNVYPTLTCDEVYVHTVLPVGSVVLYNAIGQVMLEMFSEHSSVVVSLSGFGAGMYLLRVQDATVRVFRK